MGVGRLEHEGDLRRWLHGELANPELGQAITSSLPNLDQYGYSALRHGVQAGNLITADQSAAFSALVALIAKTTYGGRLFVPAYRGPYVVNDGFVIPENRAITVEGDGPGWRSAGGRGTYLMRLHDPSAASIAATTGAMIAFPGSDVGDTHRAVGGVKRLQLDGGASAGVTQGTGVFVQRGQETPLEDVRFYNFPGTALQANQVFNASWRKLRITHSGAAAGDLPALLITAAGAPGNVDGTITLDIFGLQQEQNNGTDLKVTGSSSGTGHPSTEINFIGGKWEGGIGHTKPYHHWEFAELCNVKGVGIFCHRTAAAILSQHLLTGSGEDRGVTYTGCWFEQAAAVAAGNFFIDHQGGALHFVNCTFKLTPGTAYATIAATARPGSLTFTGCRFLDLAGGPRTKPIAVDNRAAPEF